MSKTPAPQISARLAMILLSGVALTACATAPQDFRPAYAVRTAEAPPPPAPPPPIVREEAPMAAARPAAAVEQQTLAPLPAARARDPEPEAEEAPPPRATAAPVRAQPSFRNVSRRVTTGKVVDVEGPPKTHTVAKGENLERIAKKLDTEVDQLAKDNKLKKPYVIQPGDKLKGPSTTSKAYTVVAGDTLSALGRRFGVTAAALAAENDIGRNAALRAGRKVRLPSGYRDKGPQTVTTRVAVEAPAPEPVVETAPPPRRRPAPEPEAPPRDEPPPVAIPREEPPPVLPSRPQPYAPTAAPPRAQPPRAPPPRPTVTPSAPSSFPPAAPVSAPPMTDAQISQMGRGRFAWPLRGDMISGFGPKAGGQRNDGINLASSTGQPVRAAAAGDVVYAGDQVPGFGNLVLVKHADGWVTAYGHMSRVEVKMTQKVTQGQQIGLVGSTGGVSEPQLHFEVRYAPSPLERARPIDPSLVLPR